LEVKFELLVVAALFLPNKYVPFSVGAVDDREVEQKCSAVRKAVSCL
jgi:hypothetical protein